jgi:hypothetical protein
MEVLIGGPDKKRGNRRKWASQCKHNKGLKKQLQSHFGSFPGRAWASLGSAVANEIQEKRTDRS